MSPVRIFILVIAFVAAIALAVLVRGMFGGKSAAPVAVAAAPTPPAAATVQVLTAQHDLAIGARLTSADVTWTPWPAGALNPAFITDGAAPAPIPTGTKAVEAKATQVASSMVGQGPIQALEGSIVREPMITGEPIVKRKLVHGGDSGYMAVVLSPGMRAMSVSVTVDSAAGGFILPGDRVDVMASHQLDGGKGYSSDMVLQNVKVLAVDQATEAAKDAKALVGAVATLEVSQGDAPVLARAQAEGRSNGGLTLALRSYADIGGPTGRTANALGSNGPGSTIHVYRAGQASEVTVQR
jgi:pilus assembly protein CpaB